MHIQVDLIAGADNVGPVDGRVTKRQLALLGHLSGLIKGPAAISLMTLASALLVLLALRKFGMEAAADVGDKSVFAYLEDLRRAKST